jgi:hypothetical protein
MSGNSNFQSPNFSIPYVFPPNVPPSLVPIIKPIYMALQNIIQIFITSSGIAPRNPGAVLLSAGDPTAFLANNTHRFYVQATEHINQGSLVNLVAVLGAIQVQNANGITGAKPADGFCSQAGGIPAGGIGEVILGNGMNSSMAGLTVGARYYLSTTPGSITTSPPVAAGNLQQSVGIAVSATSLVFWTGQQVQH